VDATQSNKLITLVLVFILLLSVFIIVNPVSADDVINNDISANFTIEMKSATDFKVNVEATVSKITRAAGIGTSYTANYIETIASSNPYLLGAIAGDLQVMINKTVSQTFENAYVSSLNDIPTYENGKFYDNYAVNLTSAYFELNETVNVYEFINGVLDMDARVDYNFNLHAEPGWNNTYQIELEKKIDYKETNGKVDGNKIEWTVRNGMGFEPSKNAEFRVFSIDPTTPASTDEDILLDFQLDARGSKTSLFSNILSRKINIEEYGVLPNSITNLTHLPADGIRLFVDNGLISWNDFNQTTIKPIEEVIKSKIKTSLFNQTLEIKYNWDNETTIDCQIPYEIDNMDNSPAIITILKDDDVNLEIYDISSMALFGLINSGAIANVSEGDINFGSALPEIGYTYNVTLLMPEGVLLEGMENYTWNDTVAFSGDFTSEKSPGYFEEEIDSVIEIEIQSTDLNLLSFFTGVTELSFRLKATENKNYNVTELPEEFSLPEKITVDYLNSDAFRLCIQENVFNEEEVSTFLKNNKNSFQDLLNKGLLPGLSASCQIDREKFDNSLNTNIDISDMDKEPPIEVSSYAHGSYPVSFGFSVLPPKVDIPARKINFTGIPGQSVTYRMVFPQGIKITTSDTLNKSIVDKTKDGRYYFEVTFSASEHNLSTELSYKMTPSAVFILGLFMPCIISFVILLILIIVVYLLRKKRRGRKTAVIIQEDTDSGYEDENYYVPPPPRSK